LVPIEVLYGEKSWNVFIKNLNLKKKKKNDMDSLDDMGVSKLSAKVFFLKSEQLL